MLTTLTFWESYDAIRSFAGEDMARSVVEPQARAVLLDFDAVVTHHELLVDTSTQRPMDLFFPVTWRRPPSGRLRRHEIMCWDSFVVRRRACSAG
ncbi:MAG TPA: hypothetical protein VFY84_06780 [Jiangellales bacterium]|nr:hypothetical protein [Jiangellales bacterium]